MLQGSVFSGSSPSSSLNSVALVVVASSRGSDSTPHPFDSHVRSDSPSEQHSSTPSLRFPLFFSLWTSNSPLSSKLHFRTFYYRVRCGRYLFDPVETTTHNSRQLDLLSFCSFVSHEDFPSLFLDQIIPHVGLPFLNASAALKFLFPPPPKKTLQTHRPKYFAEFPACMLFYFLEPDTFAFSKVFDDP